MCDLCSAWTKELALAYDISLPISNHMWHYQPGWENTIHAITDTTKGDSGSVYRFNLCSHTGTYIETARHKLSNGPSLNDLPIHVFTRQPTLVVHVKPNCDGCITLAAFETALGSFSDTLPANVIVACDWGQKHTATNYLSDAPWFQQELTLHLATLPLHILGVDTPIIDHQQQPYDAVRELFEKNNSLLLLAPLNLPTALVSGLYELDCAPLSIPGVSAAPCRAVLTAESQNSAIRPLPK